MEEYSPTVENEKLLCHIVNIIMLYFHFQMYINFTFHKLHLSAFQNVYVQSLRAAQWVVKHLILNLLNSDVGAVTVLISNRKEAKC